MSSITKHCNLRIYARYAVVPSPLETRHGPENCLKNGAFWYAFPSSHQEVRLMSSNAFVPNIILLCSSGAFRRSIRRRYAFVTAGCPMPPSEPNNSLEGPNSSYRAWIPHCVGPLRQIHKFGSSLAASIKSGQSSLNPPCAESTFSFGYLRA